MEFYSKEQIAEAANISIYDYARTHGYNCEKAGKEIHIRGYGGLYINLESNKFYNHREGRGGTRLYKLCSIYGGAVIYSGYENSRW